MRLLILFFVAGVFILHGQEALPPLYFLGALLILSVVLWKIPLRISRLFAALLLGISFAGLSGQSQLRKQLAPDWEMRDIEISGVIKSLPQRFARNERFVFEVENILTKDAQSAAIPARLLLSWQHRQDEFDDTLEDLERENANPKKVTPGERWQFTVRLKRAHGNANPHGFDYELWLFERGILATGSVRPKAPNKRLDDFVLRPSYAIERLRNNIRERFLSALNDAPYQGILIALAIGDQRAIPKEQWENFTRTGIAHLVSISGLHITMVASLFGFFANFLWRQNSRLLLLYPAQKAALLVGFFAALLYALLAGFAIPAQRTLIMLLVMLFALFSGRNFLITRVLLIAVLIVLIVDPFAILSAGFWLSFGAVACLFYVSAGQIHPENKTPKTRLFRATFTQLAVTLGGLPLLLFFFQQFPLTSPLANAIAIPMVSFLIAPITLLYVLIPWNPLLALAHWLVSALMQVIDFLAQFPVWQSANPPLWLIFLSAIGIFWLLLPRGIPARFIGIFLIFPALFYAPDKPLNNEVTFDILDVGQGLAVFIQTKNHSLLYDTGPSFGTISNAGERIVVPFLRGSGIQKLDVLVVSHKDKDHAGGLLAVQEALKIDAIYSSIPSLGQFCAAGKSWIWDGVTFAFLYPFGFDKNAKSNSQSCVLKVSSGTQSFLLAADIEENDEKKLINLLKNEPLSLQSGVLQVPHHGGISSSSPDFVRAVNAEEAIFSVGYKNHFRHPRPEVLARYEGQNTQIYRTDIDGSIRVFLSPSAKKITTWRKENAHYWAFQKPP